MTIRPAPPTDASAVAAIERAVFSDAWREEDIASLLSDPTGFCFAVEEEGTILAYCLGRLIVPEGEIYRIAVRPEARRRGIGRTLLSAVEDALVKRGATTLFLEVRAGNSPAVLLYTAGGFLRDGIRRAYYRDPVEDAILMHKELVRRDPEKSDE